MSQIKVDSIIPRGGLPSGANGGIIQVVQTFKTDTFSSSSSSYVDITGMTATITPQSSSSKILIDVNLNAGGADNLYAYIKVLRGSTAIGLSTAMSRDSQVNASFAAYTDHGGNSDVKAYNFGFRHLDSPNTTSSTTYKWQIRLLSGTQTNYVNWDDSNGDTDSQIVLMEIGQ